MDLRGGTKSTWKLLIVLAVVCGAVVFAAGFLHRRAVVDAVSKQQDRSAAVAKSLTNALHGVNVGKPAKGADEKQLERTLDPPAGTDIVIYSLDGQPVYATAGARSVNTDRAAVASAAKGYVSKVIDGNDMIVYAPIPSEDKGNLAVAGVVSDYAKVRDAASGPLDAARMPLMGLAIALLVAGLVLMIRDRRNVSPSAAASTPKASRFARTPKAERAPKQEKAAKPSSGKGAVSGFEPVPITEVAAATDAAPGGEGPEGTIVASEEAASKRFGFGGRRQRGEDVSEDQGAASTKRRALFGRTHDEQPAEASLPTTATSHVDEMALQREVTMRQALEDQLEQLRTRMQTQEEQAGATIRDLREQLAAGGDAPAASVGPAERDMLERIHAMEAELAEARRSAAEATEQVASLQQELSAAPTSEVSAGTAELEAQIRTLQQQFEDAQRGASESEQRAQSIESVRGELEVRVAQLGSKATELEQKAEDMEARLREANEGGDAVRAEIASLTAALAAAEARGHEFEAAAGKQAELEGEISRLRGELGRHMERAQAAEERVATLEADVLAAERGVHDLPDVAATSDRAPEHAATSDPIENEMLSDRDESHVEEPFDAKPWQREPVVQREPELEPSVYAAIASEPERSAHADLEPEQGPDREPLVHADLESEPGPEPAVHADNDLEPQREPAVHAEPEPAVHAEPEPAVHAEPEPTVADAAPSEEEPDQERVVEAQTTWRQEWRPASEPSTNGADIVSSSNGHADATASSGADASAEEPPAPSGDDRYNDVWATAFREPSSGSADEGSHANGSVDAGDPATESAPSPQAISPEPSEEQSETVSPSADPSEEESETVSAVTEASEPSEDDQPARPEDGVSVDDDLWALRARLAHAGETQSERQTPPAPSWD